MEQPGPETAILLYFVKKLNPKKVLEVGCNYGRELKLLEGLARVYGVDKDQGKVKQAKEYVKGVFKVAEADKLPWVNNTFDLVYTDGCLSHNRVVSSFLDELLRVSKGYVLTIEYVGTKLGPTSYGNPKKNTWIHDYEKLWSTKKVQVCFDRKMPYGADLFHVILLNKIKTLRKPEKIIMVPERDKEVFCLKFWKFRLKLEKENAV